jgi:hypothetical protein
LAQQKTVTIRAVDNTATIELKKLSLKCEAQNPNIKLNGAELEGDVLRQARGTSVARKKGSCLEYVN